MQIHLITKNQGKIKAARSVFDQFGIQVGNIEKEYPEIQADTSLEIARATAVQAAQENGVAVVREDHSLFIHALGIPGPYTAYIEKKISAPRLLELLATSSDRTGHFEIATVYSTPDGQTKEYVYQVPIHFKTEETVADPRHGWSGLMCLEGETRAFTEYPEEERLHVWNQNYLALAKELTAAS